MAIQVADNFQYLGQKPLDARVKYATVADMAAVATSSLYDGIMAYVVATEKNYQWKSTNTVDPTLGKWREFQSGGNGGHTIKDKTGTSMTARENLQFECNVEDDPTNNKTVVKSEVKDINYADFQALSTAEKNNGTLYCIPDAQIASSMLVVGNKFDKANIYTAKETMVGSWYGKPLYQKVMTEVITTVDVDTYFDIGASIDFARVQSMLLDNDGYVPMYNATNSFTQYIKSLVTTNNHAIQKNKLLLRTTRNEWLNKPIISIIQYTKTTDGIINIGTENDYSTDEVMVATWIDGKPVYQKTISLGSTNSGRTDFSWSSLGISNIGEVWLVNCRMNHSQGWTINSLNFYTSTADYFSMTAFGDVLRITASTEYTGGFVTVQYTKTTD